MLAVALIPQVAVTPSGGSTLAPASGFRAEYLKTIDGIGDKVTRLAERMPADKYTWRPGEGVRSVSEVYLHMAAVAYFYPSFVGNPAPAGLDPRTFPTSTTDKAKVVAALKDAFAHVHQALLNIADGDESKTMKWFRGENTYRGFLLYTAEHLGEHLGQSIAYARVNGVTPPWTEEAQSQQKKK